MRPYEGEGQRTPGDRSVHVNLYYIGDLAERACARYTGDVHEEEYRDNAR